MDKEKVIKGLEECAGNGNCTKCQYGKEKETLSCKKLLADALELIKLCGRDTETGVLFTRGDVNEGQTDYGTKVQDKN